MWPFGLGTFGYLVYFVAIGSIFGYLVYYICGYLVNLWPFGKYMVIRYIFPRFLATLMKLHFLKLILVSFQNTSQNLESKKTQDDSSLEFLPSH
jgi:hypothetical protein